MDEDANFTEKEIISALELLKTLELCDSSNEDKVSSSLKEDYIGTIVDMLKLRRSDGFYKEYKEYIGISLSCLPVYIKSGVLMYLNCIEKRMKLTLNFFEILGICDSSNKNQIVHKLKEDFVGTIIDALQLQEGDEFYEKYKDYIGTRYFYKDNDWGHMEKYLEWQVYSSESLYTNLIEPVINCMEKLKLCNQSNKNIIISKLKNDYIGTIVGILNIKDDMYNKNDIGKKYYDKTGSFRLLGEKIKRKYELSIFEGNALTNEELKILYAKNILSPQILEIQKKINEFIETRQQLSSHSFSMHNHSDIWYISKYLHSLGVKMIFTSTNCIDYIICITDFHIVFLNDFFVDFVVPLNKIKSLRLEKVECNVKHKNEQVYYRRGLTPSQKAIGGAIVGGIVAGSTRCNCWSNCCQRGKSN